MLLIYTFLIGSSLIGLFIDTFSYNNVLIFYYKQPKFFGSTKSITNTNLFITTKSFKYLSGNKN